IVQSENVTVGDGFAKLHQAIPGRYVKVSVQDTGAGMDQETLARIFEPFYTTKEGGTGSGLGLASTYGIVKNHEGIITVDSEVGKGTTFAIYLPAGDKEVEKILEVFEVEERRGTGTILFVDDEEGLISSGRRGLRMLGFDALVASSGAEAIEVYGRNSGKIDLVILDLTMPGVGGGEVFDKLKELNPKVKVLLSSGHGIDGQAEEIMDRGCDGFIQKPFDLDALSEKIHEVLDRK
ncbi:MAG: response regulator, partial [bacterium]